MATNALLEQVVKFNYDDEQLLINILARMLAGYEDATWNRLKRARKLTYIRAATTLLTDFDKFEEVIRTLI